MTGRYGALPAPELAADRTRQVARRALVDVGADALADTRLDEDDRRLVAGKVVDAVTRPEQANLLDLFGSKGKLVTRLWGTITRLHWALAREELTRRGGPQ